MYDTIIFLDNLFRKQYNISLKSLILDLLYYALIYVLYNAEQTIKKLEIKI